MYCARWRNRQVAWKWVLGSVVLAVHEAQLSEHGGRTGIRDEGALRSALVRPENRLAYGEDADAAELAAAYGFGIARSHPFVDGNKRAALVTMELFLEINGWELNVDDASCIATMEAVAAGTITEAQFATWVRSHIEKL
jgi:death-on-curing protein